MTDDGRLFVFGGLALIGLAGLGRRGQAARQGPPWLDQFDPEPIRRADGKTYNSSVWWGPGGPHENENYIEVIEEGWEDRPEFRVRQYTVLDSDDPNAPAEWSREEVFIDRADFAAAAAHTGRVIPQTVEWAVSIGLAMISDGRWTREDTVTAGGIPDPMPRRISFREPNQGPRR